MSRLADRWSLGFLAVTLLVAVTAWCDICRAVVMMWNCEMQSNACRGNVVGLVAAVFT
jgi:hypothetical protein